MFNIFDEIDYLALTRDSLLTYLNESKSDEISDKSSQDELTINSSSQIIVANNVEIVNLPNVETQDSAFIIRYLTACKLSKFLTLK